jgi:hypothetical protein
MADAIGSVTGQSSGVSADAQFSDSVAAASGDIPDSLKASLGRAVVMNNMFLKDIVLGDIDPVKQIIGKAIS